MLIANIIFTDFHQQKENKYMVEDRHKPEVPRSNRAKDDEYHLWIIMLKAAPKSKTLAAALAYGAANVNTLQRAQATIINRFGGNRLCTMQDRRIEKSDWEKLKYHQASRMMTKRLSTLQKLLGTKFVKAKTLVIPSQSWYRISHDWTWWALLLTTKWERPLWFLYSQKLKNMSRFCHSLTRWPTTWQHLITWRGYCWRRARHKHTMERS